MKTKTRTLSPEVRTALASIEWDGGLARLTCGQLDRKTYVAVNDALESLGGKWSKKDKAHVFDDAAHNELEAVIETGSYDSAADIKQVLGEFFTPDGLADEIVRLAEIDGDHMVLEPSAGTGQLVKAVNRAVGFRDGDIEAVEIQQRHMIALKASDCNPNCADFLTVEPAGERYDRVVMNPPFARQADIDHVMHAWSFLKPGGRLVAIMSTGWTFRTNQKSRDFQEFAQTHGEWWANDDGAFKESGTSVKTVTVVLDKSA
jgi:predicted RNA methylase